MAEVVDKDGLTRYDYYMSLADPVYPASQANITYSKNVAGHIIRSCDIRRLKKNADGVLVEDNVNHREDDIIGQKTFAPLINAEEFIKNAK